MVFKYNRSTFSLAQVVFLKKVRLDLIDGLCVKQRILILIPSSSHPYSATRCSSMSASLIPCRGLFGWGLLESSVMHLQLSYYSSILQLISIKNPDLLRVFYIVGSTSQ